MKRIYFDLDNPSLLTWLKTRPQGTYALLLGSDAPNKAVDILFSKVTTEGRDFVSWLTRGSRSKWTKTNAKDAPAKSRLFSYLTNGC
jgi:hypothetical protein